MNDPRQQPGLPPAQQAMSWLVFIAHSLATPLEICLHSRFGARYFGMRILGGLIAMPVVAMFLPREDPRPLWAFGVLYLVMLTKARIGAAIRFIRKQDREHSYYNGWPMLIRFAPNVGEVAFKRRVEPVITMALALGMGAFSPTLGAFLFAGTIGLGLSNHFDRTIDRERELNMRDSLIDQRHFVEQFRDREP